MLTSTNSRLVTCIAGLALCGLGGGISGCDDADKPNSVEDAADEVGDAMENAAEKADDVGEEIKEGAEEVKDELTNG